MKQFFENLFLTCTGYTYTNMARLFIRLFVGIMLLQFGIRHLVHYQDLVATFPSVMCMGHEASMIVMILIELGCSLLIMAGFLTRLAVIPPIVAMIIAEHYILHNLLPDTLIYSISSTQPGYLPLMFIGIYLFILLAGPGKISLDYFISLYIISTRGKDQSETEELEEV
ncbi:MAG: DoxX family protein [Muribaculum sp.]|nr:DoxX family protein [Muribaculaceae bacterium]MCM1081472.1 DoxX family protein [Muribaculum sp.]